MHGGWSSQLSYGAITHYKAGYKRAAWWFLGHAAHLIGDLSVPSHVDNENSHGVYGATYHRWMDHGGYAFYTYTDAITQGRPIDPYGIDAAGDPVRFLAYTTAQLGNSFPWASTVSGTYYGSDGNRVAGGYYPHYDNYMSQLFGKIPSRPTVKWHVNKDEVMDSCAGWLCRSECQLVDWVGWTETRSDCYDHDGQVDYDNTDNDGSNADGDMGRIAQYNYPYAVRTVASMVYYFAKEADALDYCPTKGSSSSYEWVDSVSVDGRIAKTGNNNGYYKQPGDMWNLGKNWHQVTLTPGFGSGAYVENWKVWIDFNQNFVMDSDELVAQGSGSAPLQLSFQIPTTAKSGSTRMRVSMEWGNAPDACRASFNWGEAEDYQINVY